MSGGLSGMSDAELLSALGQQPTAPATSPDLSGLSDDDLMRQLGQPGPRFSGTPVEGDASQPRGPRFSGTPLGSDQGPASLGTKPDAPRTWGDTATDIGRSVLSGLDAGVAGIAGAPADAARGISWAKDRLDARLTGQDADQLGAARDASAPIPRSMLANYGGDAFHQGSGLAYAPETTGGRYAETIASFVPGAALGPGSLMRRFLLGAGLPGAASEAAGQATAGTAAEPYARVAAALAAPAAAARAITPIGVPGARAPLVATLDREGVPISAGQWTGNSALQNIEAVLSDVPGAGGGARQITEQTQRGLNRAVAQRFGEDADLLTPDVMQRAADRIGGVFADVAGRRSLQYDAQMGQDVANMAARYGRKLPSQQRDTLGNLIQDIRDQVVAGGGQIPGPTYQQARSDLSKIAQGARQSDPLYSQSAGGLRDALDGAFERSVAGTADAGALGEARRQYGAMKTAEQAMNVPGVVAAEGHISPDALRSAVARRDPAAYARGEGDMADLARAVTAVRPLPNSGTAPRLMANSVVHSLGAMGDGLLAGAPGATVAGTGAAAFVLPALAGRAITSRPVQAYLGNDLIRGGGGLPAAGSRALQAYEDADVDPLMLRVHPRR